MFEINRMQTGAFNFNKPKEIIFFICHFMCRKQAKQILLFQDLTLMLSLHWVKLKFKIPPGLEPRTFCVLSRRDNHYTTEPHMCSYVLILVSNSYNVSSLKRPMFKFIYLIVLVKENVPTKYKVSPGLEPGTFCV